MPTPDSRRWASAVRAAVAVILVSQRESGLWGLPTSPEDQRRTFANPKTTEGKLRSEDPFGHASISVTWRVLQGLQAALGEIPRPILEDALGAVDDLRSSTGAYGRRGPVWKAESSINESARHTAMGLLVRLHFGGRVPPPSSVDECLPSVIWLLDHALPQGGWLYQQAHPEEGPEALTIAYTLFALTEFERIAGPEFINRAGLDSRLVGVVGAAFDTLEELKQGSIWRLQVQEDTELSDAADIATMLLRASRGASLVAARPNARASVVEAVALILRENRNEGMPAKPGSRVVSPSASIAALYMTDALDIDELDEHSATTTEMLKDAVLKDAFDRDTWRHLSAWDWAALALATAPRMSPGTSFPLSAVRSVKPGCQANSRATALAHKFRYKAARPSCSRSRAASLTLFLRTCSLLGTRHCLNPSVG